DFKPTNVIVGPNGHVTVVDFGLARSAELDTTVSEPGHGGVPTQELLSTRLTGTNVIVGTNGYMAPEQLLGLTVGPRADQFSFCVALHEALYGVRPFPGKNPVEVARAFAEGRRIEPENTRGVPPWLHQALLRGLSTDPGERYPSMDALLAALRRKGARPRTRLRWTAALLATAVLSGAMGA
ncbi:MAG: protein kinase, partial [Myxococcales bacterium]|nr:protein kinase [Myxococcales bacterium]